MGGRPGSLIEELDSKSSAEALEAPTSWVRTWLACVALYYPALWIAFSAHEAVPAFIRILFSHQQLAWFRVLPFGGLARSVPTGGLPQANPAGISIDRVAPEVVISLLLVLVITLTGVARRSRTLGGLLVAVLANFTLLPPLARLVFERQLATLDAVTLVVFFVPLCLGLRWMLSGWVRSGYWVRLGSLTAGFVGLPLVVWAALRLFADFRFGTLPLLLIAPGALAALLVSIRPASNGPRLPTWKAAGMGAAATLLLVMGSNAAGHRLNQAVARVIADRNHAALAAYPEVPGDLPYPKLFFQKGVNYTAEAPYNYDSDGARRMLEMLPAYGINAIALMPYGWSPRGKPEVHLQGEGGWESDEGLEQLSRVAHARGMKVMLKPAIWDSFNLDFPKAEDRLKWFDQYGTFLEHYARLAKRMHADLLCVGGEFVHLTQYDSEWRKLIARTRELYPGPLVYAANHGSEFETITFWDALDYIGLQEYYPLPDDLSTNSIVQRVEAVQQKFSKPVIFTEVGFPSLQDANREPWDDNNGRKVSLSAQAACTEAILRAFYGKPWFEGMYWWRLETNGSGGQEDGSHSLWKKPALDVVKRWYVNNSR